MVERGTLYKKTGKVTDKVVLGVTSRKPEPAGPERTLKVNRGHWTIENRCHHVIDWNFDEDRGRIRIGHGPENITRLRRFACGVTQYISKGKSSICQKMQ